MFGENRRCKDRVRFIKEVAIEVGRAHAFLRGSSARPPRVQRMIAWSLPQSG